MARVAEKSGKAKMAEIATLASITQMATKGQIG